MLALHLAACVLYRPLAGQGASSRCGAVRACSPVEDVPTVYTPFLESMFAIFAEQGIELEPYPLAEELRQRSVTSGPSSRPRHVQLSLQAHRSTKLRHIRAAHIQGGDGLQVLNICLFPHLEFALPTFSADLVTLPGGHLIAIDLQPNDPSALPDADGGRLSRLYEEHRQRLPDGRLGPVEDPARPLLKQRRIGLSARRATARPQLAPVRPHQPRRSLWRRLDPPPSGPA